ncbi:MAG: DUF1998 domain-containing protein, partial [Polyangiales bacterium]
HKAYIRYVDPDYYTEAMTYAKVSVLEVEGRKPSGRAVAAWGEVQVVEKVVGYKKIKFHTHENVGYGDVRLPDLELHTTSCWLTIPENVVLALADECIGRAAVVDGLRGLGRALEAVASLALMCDPRDLSIVVEDQPTAESHGNVEPEGTFAPTLHLYDAYAGGIGLSPRIFEQHEELLRRARALVEGCACQTGCPTCVGPTIHGDPKKSRRAIALRLVDALGLVLH